MSQRNHFTRREWMAMTAAVSSPLLAKALHAADATKAPGRPNVIILLTDDQGYGDMSCHGNPVLKTPNMDKLHDQSVRLADFHVAPMCTPTRSQLLTGQDCLRNGAMSVCAGRSFIRRGIPTMAEIFLANGYRTGHFGKWHLGDNYPNLPHQKGFEDTVYHLGWGITSMADLWCNDYFDGRFRRNGVMEQFKGYCTDIWFDLAMRWMKERREKNEPFFLYLPTNAPHGPLWCPEKYKKMYQGKGPAAFFGMLANIDDNIGRLDAFLEETGLKDNTILIFMNDNGGTAGVKTYNAGMRAGKTTYYDGGHRAACFIRWPAGGLGPRDVRDLTQIQDLLPTLIDLCGMKKPESAKFDGTSLAKIVKGAQQSLPNRMLVVQYGQRPVKWECCAMWNKWRLVNGRELYDLTADPGQAKNVAADHPDVFMQMHNHYERWWAGIEPVLDDFTPIVIGSGKENPACLSAADWSNTYCDNMGNLRAGLNANGPWNIFVEQDGEYEIALRRWPKEADAAIAAGVPEFQAVDGTLPAGKALPIMKARLKVGDVADETKPVRPEDKEVVFTARLKRGMKMQMQSWFYGADDRQLCGAYFAYVQRK